MLGQPRYVVKDTTICLVVFIQPFIHSTSPKFYLRVVHKQNIYQTKGRYHLMTKKKGLVREKGGKADKYKKQHVGNVIT